MKQDELKILVVDDDKIMLNLLYNTFKKTGQNVETAEDGQQAVNILRKKTFDIVITDLNMPRMDGISLLKTIRRDQPQIIVIVITGFASLDTAMIAIKEGAYDYITKPFQIEEVLHAVARAKEKIYLLMENKMLMKKLHEAYDKISSLLNNKDEFAKELAEVDTALQLHHQELVKGVFELKRYQSDLAQKEYLQPNQNSDDILNRIEIAGKMKDRGQLTDTEYRKVKSKILEQA